MAWKGFILEGLHIALSRLVSKFRYVQPNKMKRALFSDLDDF